MQAQRPTYGPPGELGRTGGNSQKQGSLQIPTVITTCSLQGLTLGLPTIFPQGFKVILCFGSPVLVVGQERELQVFGPELYLLQCWYPLETPRRMYEVTPSLFPRSPERHTEKRLPGVLIKPQKESVLYPGQPFQRAGHQTHYQKSVCCFFFFLINSAPAFFFFLIGSLNSVSVNCCDSYLNVIFFNTSVKELHASKFSISIAQPRQGPATTMEVNQSGYN